MIDFLNNEKCMGCSACVNICPTQCLSLKKNKEGFLYPEITGIASLVENARKHAR